MLNNASDVKGANMAAVLKVIHSQKAISKGNIATELGLTTVTVNKLVGELCEKNICVETGEYVSYGGRKAALYRINSNYAVIFGVRLTRSRICFTVYDFSLQKIEEEIIEIGLEELNSVLKILIEKLCFYKKKYLKKNIIGAGICIPGRASKSGVVIDMPEYPHWNSIDLGLRLKDATGIDIYVDNDANAAALSSKWCGFSGNMENFVYLKLDEGLGAGVMVDGEIFSGSSNCGCELGHITINVLGEPCKCGRKGCAQAYLAASSIKAKCQEAIGQKLTSEEIIALYNAGNKEIKNILEEFVSYLGIVLDNVFFIFDTEAIILQNALVSNLPSLAEKLKGGIFENEKGEVIRSFRRRPPVYIMNDVAVKEASAAAIVYEKFMKNEY